MNASLEFSRPVVVDEGIAFCVRLADGRKRVAVATKARLGIGDDAQEGALLAAFLCASNALHAEAASLVQSGAPNPIYLERP